MATASNDDTAGQTMSGFSARGRTRWARWVAWAAERSRGWRLLSWLGLVFLLALTFAFGTDAGVSYDEEVQRRYGDMVLAWFRTGFADRSATTYYDLYFYGGLFDLIAQWVAEHSPIGVFETRHVISALVAVAGIAASWLMAARVGGPRAGFFAALCLTLTPMWVGHGLMNPKDIPFGTAAAFVGVASLRIVMSPAPLRLRDACIAGLAVGIALAARPGGVFVLGYPYLAAGLRVGLELARRKRRGEPLALGRAAGNLALCGALIPIVAWPVMLSAWPWAQIDPIAHPLEAMRVARKFGWNAPMRYDGGTIYAQDVPLSYLPQWFSVTLPELYLLASIAGAALLIAIGVRRRWQADRVLGAAMIASLVVVPMTAVFVARPVLYDAQRHFLFVLPPFASLAGLALSEAIAGRWFPRLVGRAIAAAFAVLAVLVAIDTVQLHPYEYVYFNRWSGGLKAQVRRYESDYWGVSYREGLEWVVRELGPVHPNRRTRIAGCDASANDRLEYYRREWGLEDKIRITRIEDADILLAIRRWDCHRRTTGKVLHRVKRQDATLLYVRSLRQGVQ